MENNKSEQNSNNASRRRLLKALATTGGAMATGSAVLPAKWVSPVVNSIMLPAHAQTSLVVGNFGPAELRLSRRESPSVLDLVVPRAEARPALSATVGNITFSAYWMVGESGANICGTAVNFNNATPTVTLSGTVGRSGDSLGNFQQEVNGPILKFTGQQVGNNGVSLTASVDVNSSPLFAQPSAGGCGSNSSIVLNTSSPYPDDEGIV